MTRPKLLVAKGGRREVEGTGNAFEIKIAHSG